jgi:hypothetical protein
VCPTCGPAPSQNKSQEKFAVGTRLVEIAVKFLEHAVVFRAMETSAEKDKVTLADVAGAFQKARAPLTDEEAETIAAMILARSNDDNGTDTQELLEMDYVEYVNSIEATMLDFDDFKKLALPWARKKGYRMKLAAAQFKNAAATVYPEPQPAQSSRVAEPQP